MAAGGLLALLDDIAILADDVAVMTAKATKKTAGIIGDDIAVNAKQVIGIPQDREIPAVKRLLKGSFINKAILAPVFFGLGLVKGGALIPFCLLAGATYLCYEGAEKVLHKMGHSEKHEQHKKELLDAAHNDPKKSEDQKVKSAITTDFVLSAEIMAITLGSVATMSAGAAAFGTAAVMGTQFAALCAVGALTTVVTYGLVAGFLRLDNWGLALAQKENKLAQWAGHNLVERVAPFLTKALAIGGTAAMFVVGGELFLKELPHIFHALEPLATAAHSMFHFPLGETIVLPMIAGVAAGAVLLPTIEGTKFITKPLMKPIKSLANKVKGLFSKNEPELAPEKKSEPIIVNAPKPAEDESHQLDVDDPAIKEPGISAKDALSDAAGTSSEPENEPEIIDTKIEDEPRPEPK